ncbi:DNA-binding response regulator [Bacillus infantis]|uniref:DNA-binding response regulator n=1 Tax=Bacillus infantis TaxID=324767 RepID=UPI002006A9F2|nr:DNA-binding response regulator [Bacillus infantis]MCK6203941.1 DNA-binding response regulator [Bacillus infantis]
MKTFNDIENALRDYHWMIKEIMRLKEELNTSNASVTAAYGIEASMPKGSGTSDPTGREVIQRDRRHKTLKKFEEKVKFIEQNSSCINDDRELTVLNCMLDGLNIVSISQHMGFSERKVYGLKDEIVKKMKENAENAGFAGIAG